MKAQTRLTKHGKRRIRERVDTIYKDNNLVRIVSKNGKSKNIYQGSFRQYLENKTKSGIKLKIYNNNIYILSKNTSRLITTYPIPDKYIPIEQYEISEEMQYILYMVIKNKNTPVIIELKNGNIYKGYIEKESLSNIITKITIKKNDERIKIELEDIKSIKIDEDILSKDIRSVIDV